MENDFMFSHALLACSYVLSKNEPPRNINTVYVRWTALFCLFFQIGMKMPILNLHLDRKITIITTVEENVIIRELDAIKCAARTRDFSEHTSLLTKHADEDWSRQPGIGSFSNVYMTDGILKTRRLALGEGKERPHYIKIKIIIITIVYTWCVFESPLVFLHTWTWLHNPAGELAQILWTPLCKLQHWVSERFDRCVQESRATSQPLFFIVACITSIRCIVKFCPYFKLWHFVDSGLFHKQNGFICILIFLNSAIQC